MADPTASELREVLRSLGKIPQLMHAVKAAQQRKEQSNPPAGHQGSWRDLEQQASKVRAQLQLLHDGHQARAQQQQQQRREGGSHYRPVATPKFVQQPSTRGMLVHPIGSKAHFEHSWTRSSTVVGDAASCPVSPIKRPPKRRPLAVHAPPDLAATTAAEPAAEPATPAKNEAPKFATTRGPSVSPATTPHMTRRSEAEKALEAQVLEQLNGRTGTLRRALRKLDPSHSGHVNTNELQSALAQLGVSACLEQIDALAQRYCLQGRNEVNYDKLLHGLDSRADAIGRFHPERKAWVGQAKRRVLRKILEKTHQNHHACPQLAKVLQELDPHHRGTVSWEQLLSGLQTLGVHLSEDDGHTLHAVADPSSSGQVHYEQLFAEAHNTIQTANQEDHTRTQDSQANHKRPAVQHTQRSSVPLVHHYRQVPAARRDTTSRVTTERVKDNLRQNANLIHDVFQARAGDELEINAAELQQGLHLAGAPVSSQDAKSLMAYVDLNNDGVVCYHEMCQALAVQPPQPTRQTLDSNQHRSDTFRTTNHHQQAEVDDRAMVHPNRRGRAHSARHRGTFDHTQMFEPGASPDVLTPLRTVTWDDMATTGPRAASASNRGSTAARDARARSVPTRRKALAFTGHTTPDGATPAFLRNQANPELRQFLRQQRATAAEQPPPSPSPSETTLGSRRAMTLSEHVLASPRASLTSPTSVVVSDSVWSTPAASITTPVARKPPSITPTKVPIASPLKAMQPKKLDKTPAPDPTVDRPSSAFMTPRSEEP